MNEENRKNSERKRKCDDLLEINKGKIIKSEIEDTSGTESYESVPLFASSIKEELDVEIKSEPEDNVEDLNDIPNDYPKAIKDECNIKFELFEESETCIQLFNNTTKQPQAGNSKTKKQMIETQAIGDGLPWKIKQNTEKYEIKDGTVCINTIDEKVLEITKVNDLKVEYEPPENNIDTSSLNYNFDTERDIKCNNSDMESRDFLIESTDTEEPAQLKRRRSSSVAETPEIKNNLTEIKKNSVRNLSTCIIKRKKDKQINEDALTNKKLEILEIQHQQEVMKLEKTRTLLDLDIELKRVLLENAKLDLELKKKNS